MMDPYQVLGVSRNASDDEIKKAYRNLSRKYHPDANVNNPNKEQAEERFKQVQQAYDMIMKQKTSGADSSYGYGDPFGFGARRGTYNSGTTDPNEQHLQAAANYISNGYYAQAINVLNSIPFAERRGRWYYFAALAYSGQGDTATATSYINRAVELEPGNMEYRQMKEYMENGGNWYSNRAGAYGDAYTGAGGSWCMSMLLANLLCHCCTPC